MTFLSGFAEGYINERNRRLEEQSRKDEIKFKYKMDYLTSQRDLRTKKKKEEEEYYKKANDLSSQLGDTDATSTFYQELSNGVSYETLQKRIGEGAYARNPNYTKPAQTVKVPKAVSQTVSYDLEGTNTPEWEKINKDIDSIDPTLRSGIEDNEYSTVAENSEGSSPYMYKPTNQYKIGSYEQSLANLEREQNKEVPDPEKLRQYQMEVDIHRRVASEKVAAEDEQNRRKAEYEGKDLRYHIPVTRNAKGKLVMSGSGFNGRVKVDESTGRNIIVNVDNPMTNDPHNELGGEIVSGDTVTLDELQRKRLYALTDKYQERITKYDAGKSSFITAVDTSTQIERVLQETPEAATLPGRALQMINQLDVNLKAGYEILTGKQDTIKAKIESGDLEGIEGLVADYTKSAHEYANSALNSRNRNIAANVTALDSLKIAAAYQFAVAQGVTTGKMSNQDFENNYTQIAAAGTADEIRQGLRLTAQSAFTRIRSAQASLDQSNDVKMFEKEVGFETGLRAQRVGETIMSMDEQDMSEIKKKELMLFMSVISGQQMEGEIRAAESSGAGVRPQVQPQNAEALVPDAQDEKMLLSDPSDENKRFFDEAFGPGAADRILKSRRK